MAKSNRLVARGGTALGFSTALTHERTTPLCLGEKQLRLTKRGRSLLAKLLDAEPETVDSVEQLLAGKTTAHKRPTRTGELVSPERAAALLGVSRPTVVRWAREGTLADHRVGSHHKFALADVLALRTQRLQTAEANRRAAEQAREQARAAGALDRPPTREELVAAGRALRDGDRTAAAGVLARARRADARRASASASAS